MSTFTHPLAERLTRAGSPFELISGPGGRPRVFRHAPRSLQVLFQNLARFGPRTCMSMGGVEISFARIFAEAHSLGSALALHHGVRRGVRVAVSATDTPAWLASLGAIWWAGGVVVVLDRKLEDLARLAALDSSDCEIVITDRQCSSQLRLSGDRRPHITVRAECDWTAPGYFDGVAVLEPTLTTPCVSDPDEDALIAFTSGSTGVPKGVVSTHRAIVSGMLNSLLSAALTSARDRTRSGRIPAPRAAPCSLLLSPFSHVGGYSHLILMTHLAGKVVPHTWDTARSSSALLSEKVTVLSGASSQVLSDLLRLEVPAEPLQGLSTITLYGATPSRRLILEMHSRFPAIQLGTGYGLTETNGSICSASGEELLERPGTCGPVLPSVDVRIRDPSGTEASAGSCGEIWIRGSMLARRYISARHASGGPTDSDGWFCTEDIGWRDSDGYLYVSERRQDVFHSCGRRVACQHIERLLCDSGMAADAAALAVEAPRREARLVVAIVPACGGVSHESLSAWLQGATSLPDEQIVVLTLERLPRTSSGKPDRVALRRLASAMEPSAEGAGS